MFDPVQTGTRRKHPARKYPLHLALQRDLIDLDKGVSVGGFGSRAGVAGIGLDPQRAELNGFAYILVKIDDAPGDLVQAGKLAFLLTIFWAGGSVTTSSPGCSVAGDCGTVLAWRPPGGLAFGGAAATP